MTKKTHQGTCSLCKQNISKSGMTRHLSSHDQLPGGIRLLVTDLYSPEFWLQLAMEPQAELTDIDKFLRHIWLECCGHLSMFRIENKNYESHYDPVESEYADGGMDILLSKLIKPGLIFTYDYDFGSTTRLKLKVVSIDKNWKAKENIVLLARNNPLGLICVKCGKKADKLCIGCEWENEENTYCSKCYKNHKCKSGDDIWLPVVNSPRMGVCGYTGDTDD